METITNGDAFLIQYTIYVDIINVVENPMHNTPYKRITIEQSIQACCHDSINCKA